MQINFLTFCTPHIFWVGHGSCADNYNLIELSDLIGFGYDVSDTQDGLKCWKMGFIFCGKHPLPLTRIRMSDPGPKGSLVKLLIFFLIIVIQSVVNTSIDGSF